MLLLCVVFLFVLVPPAAALEHPGDLASRATIEASIAAAEPLDPALAERLSTSLARTVQEVEARQGVAGPEERTYVYVYLEPGQRTAILDGHLAAIVNRDDEYGIATARATAGELRTLASLEGVRSVREVVAPVFLSPGSGRGDGTVPYTGWTRWIAANRLPGGSGGDGRAGFGPVLWGLAAL